MAKRTVLFDDITGKEIPEGEGGTIRFSLQDEYYEVDLSKESFTKLEKALKPFLDVAMSVDAPHQAPPMPRTVGARKATASGRGSGMSKDQLDAVRTWLRSQGHDVSDRGRIKGDLMALYEEAHKK